MAPVADLPSNMQAKITVHPISDCWNWTGARNSRGYGCVTDGTGRSMLAHRRSYTELVGPIPEGLTIDHLCRNILCQNPSHMEPVTRSENSRRGHDYHDSRAWVYPEPPDPMHVAWLEAHNENAMRDFIKRLQIHEENLRISA